MISLNAMEQDEEKKKKMNDDVVVFMRKRSETEVPRYTARLKTYVDIQHKHARADAARRHSEHGFKKSHASRKKPVEQKQTAETTPEHAAQEEERMSRRGHVNEHIHRGRSVSGSRVDFEPSDRSRRRRPRRTCCGRGCIKSRRRRPRRTCCGRGCRRRRRRRSRRRRRRRRSRRRRRRSRRRRRRRCCGR